VIAEGDVVASLSTFEAPVIVRPSPVIVVAEPADEAVAVKTVVLLIALALDGAATKIAATAAVSVATAVLAIVTGTTMLTAWPVVPPYTTGVPTVTDVLALAGATEVRTPKPREATATSAMRLKVVFVDICFLSISRSEEFPPLGFG